MGRSRRNKQYYVAIKSRENSHLDRMTTGKSFEVNSDGHREQRKSSSSVEHLLVCTMDGMLNKDSVPPPGILDAQKLTAELPSGCEDEHITDVTPQDNRGHIGQLHSALLSCDVAKIKHLLKERPELDEKLLISFVHKIKTAPSGKKPNSKISLFYFAILQNELQVCTYLIDDGARLNLPRCKYTQPLEFALYWKRYEVAQLLVSRGADVLTYNTRDEVPMYHALDDTPTVEHILKAGFPVNEVIEKRLSITALQMAAVSGKKDVVQTLIKHGADLSLVSTFWGLKAIEFAVFKNQPRIIKLLASHGADVNSVLHSNSLLISAIKLGYGNVVKQLIDAGASVHTTVCEDVFVSPLHYAINNFRPKIVQLLLQKGAKVNAKCMSAGKTPLLTAVSKCFKLPKESEDKMKITQIIDILLDHGADINARTMSGATALKTALIADNYDAVRLLLSAGAKCKLNMLLPAVIRGDASAVKTCLEFGEDYNCLYQDGETIYHQALARQGPKALSLFWKHGCPFDQSCAMTQATTKENKTHIKIQQKFIKAIGNNDFEEVKNMLESGAEPRGCSEAIKSPIHLVAKRGFKEVAQILLERGVPANTVYNGETPLMVAARKGHVEVCEALLQHGASFDCAQSGQSPLQITTCKKLKKIFKTLKQIFNMTKRGDIEVLEKLEYNAQNNLDLFWALVNAIDPSGHTLMSTALRRGHTEVATGIMKCRLQAKPTPSL